MKATDFLQAAIDVQAERGKDYDKPEGERSMGAAVRAFNAITGHDLTEAEGWLILECLKNVRQWQNPGRYHHDSALDGVAYSSLKAEALHAAACAVICETARPVSAVEPEWQPGDLLEVIEAGTHGFRVGEIVRIVPGASNAHNGFKCANLSGCDFWWVRPHEARWHSRPERANG